MKKKVLFYTFGLPYGGTTTALIALIQQLIDDYEIDIFSFHNVDSDLVQQLPTSVRIIHPTLNLAKTPKWLHPFHDLWWSHIVSVPKRLNKIIKLFTRKEYDIEIAYTETSDAVLTLARKSSTSKKILWCHTDILQNEETQAITKVLSADVLRQFDVRIAISKTLAQQLSNHYQLSFQAVYNIFNQQLLRDKASEMVHFNQHQLPNVLYIGRFAKVKSVDRLIKAHAKIVKQQPHHLQLIGHDGGELSRLKHLVNQLNVQSTVHFLGGQTNPYPYLTASDGLILTSLTEGLPTVLIEAMLLDQLAVSVDVGAAKEILPAQQIFNNDDEGIEKALLYLLNRPIISYDVEQQQRFLTTKQVKQIFEGEV